MKSLFKIFFVLQMFFLFFCNQLITAPAKYEVYDEQDFEDITFGCRNMRRSDLRYAPLGNIKFSDGLNLERSWLGGASFKSSRLRNATLKKVNAVRASFREANLESADLSHGNFTEALFWNANLKDIKAEKAIFYRAKGLTNEQKQYLRNHGALKVPLDIIYEPEDYDKEVFDPSTLSCKEKLTRYFTWKFKSKNQGTQRFEEDLEDYPKEVYCPKTNLSLKEKIHQYLIKKYKWYFYCQSRGTQTEEISIETD